MEGLISLQLLLSPRRASGNPLSYYNGTQWTFTWNNGRRLTKAVSSGTTVTYTYNLEGLRTGKTVGGVTHNYLYAGGKLMRETYGSNTLDFFYDANGAPYALKHNGTVYYYITNLQGDVTYLVNASGAAVATYEYDPYGKVTTATGTLAQTNPLRYRGYYYDNETGLYYLQSRYYDPAVGRFINADAYVSTGHGTIGYNMYAYCNNNSVNRIDPSGHLWEELKELWNYFCSTLYQSKGYFTAALGVSQADTALPGPADVVSAILIGVGILGCMTIATHSYFTATSKPTAISKSVAKAESITKESEDPVVFPIDPNSFNPVGLVKVVRPGTKNGCLISWMDPIANVAVFRWDENTNFPNGPHYHVVGQNTHYYAGSIVPEPFATIYFPN